MKQKLMAALLTVVLVLSFGMVVSAESTNYNVNTPYYSYTYNSSHEAIQTPAPYAVIRTLDGTALGIEPFANLQDVCFDPQTQQTVLVDTGTNRVVILDKDYRVAAELRTFMNGAEETDFSEPSGACVRNAKLYVADTGNARILVFDMQTFSLLQELRKPDSPLLGESYTYKPRRLAVDISGRLYCIATDINDGVLLLDTDGSFVRYVAAPKVKLTLWDKFLRSFMTKEQKKGLSRAMPTEYSSIVMDDKGFLYLTSSDTTVHPISRLNSQGTDVLKYDGQYPDGDSSHPMQKQTPIKSVFVDIAVRENGLYAAIDSKMGRVFTYDAEGNLLYAFGGIGAQEGLFYSPSAIEFREAAILVTDSFYGTLTVFDRTTFGQVTESATDCMYQGKYSEAQTLWEDVLRLSPTYTTADLNLARIDIQNGAYKTALGRLEGTADLYYYSKAYEGIREQVLRKHFYWIIALLLGVVLLCVGWRTVKKRLPVAEKLRASPLIGQLRYSRHTAFHPFDGFWDLKREKRGSLTAAHILTALFLLAYALRAQFSGYLFTGVPYEKIDSIFELIKVVLPLGLWVVSNWCFTTLMNGEGTLKDIYIATAYALRPYIVTAVPLCLLSHCLSLDEMFICTTLSSIVTLWTLALLFFGMMTTHDYSLGRGIVVTVLSLIGICLIFFIALTFANIVQTCSDFAAELFREFMYRTY